MWFFIRCVIQDAAYQTRGIILHPGCDGAGRRLASSISDSLSSSFKKKTVCLCGEKYIFQGDSALLPPGLIEFKSQSSLLSSN